MNRLQQAFSILLSFCIVLTTLDGSTAYAENEPNPDTPVVSAQPSAEQLQQLVAPIALYPDSLVAQILAASTYPEQVVEADRWVQANPTLKGDQLAQAVDEQNWDPSVKALTAFPSVLANMDKNLSWATSLGETYINDQQAVMNAVQEMRHNAQKAGDLKSTPQINVTDQGQTVVIEPANPEVVYVPEYDPWIVYGVAVAPWPGWYWYPGLYWTSPGIGFGMGFGIGFFSGFSWGWHHWAPDWYRHTIVFNHLNYISHSRSVINRNYYINREHNSLARGGSGGFHGADAFHGINAFHGGATFSQHGFASPSTNHTGAFGSFDHGGVVGGYSARGFSSLGGFHGGMAGLHGGTGFHGGGRR